MPQLTDEEKAKAILNDVDSEKKDETVETDEADKEEEQEEQETEENSEETESEEEQSTEDEEEAETEESKTFTKQFPNLKGETKDEYVKSLEEAYQNSTTEALRLKTVADDSAKLVDEAKRIIANANSGNGNNQVESGTETNPSLLTLDSNPDVQYAKALREKDMVEAFDKFTKEYPQAREPDDFDRFQKASTGAYQAFEAGRGRKPTFGELYLTIANTLGWQPVTNSAKKDAAIKNATASSQTISSTQSTAKQPKVSDAEIDVYQRMFPSKDRATAVKELSEVKNS